MVNMRSQPAEAALGVRGARADNDRAGPEYRYLDWYATANTDYVIDEQQVTETNDIFDLAVSHPPLDVASSFATTPGMNRTHSSDMLQRTLP